MYLAFGNKARVGKDEACSYYQKKYGGTILRFADPLYEIASTIQEKIGLEKKKDPALLQFLGENLRKMYGEDIWINALIEKIKGLKGNIFIADMRYKNEAEALKKLGFTCVKIIRDDRPIDRDPNHKSEIDLDDWDGFMYTIYNNKKLEDFHESLDAVLSNYLKHNAERLFGHFKIGE